MFELKDGQDYNLYNNINADPFTWKMYNISEQLQENEHSMLEIRLDISDAVLMGSANSVKNLKEVISTYQVEFDNKMLRRDAYYDCKRKSFCRLTETMADILNAHYAFAYAVLSD